MKTRTDDARRPASAGGRPDRSTAGDRGRWMALVAALLGWMFDGFEIGMFPLVGRPALTELLGTAGAAGTGTTADVNGWFGVIMAVFLIGAATGGVLFGWLGDRIGRVRAMSLSILTYALFTGACGLATEAWHIAVLRFIASLGMGGEWSLGVALVNEVWPARSRAWIAGLIGAASNVGIGLVPVVSIALVSLIASVRGGLSAVLPAAWVEPLLANQAWRFLMIAGALPALLVFFIRAFVPESERWEEERASGRTSHWAVRDLIATVGGAVGAAAVIFAWSPAVDSGLARAIVTPLGILAAFFGFVHPVRMYLRRALAAGAVGPADAAIAGRRLILGALLAGVPLLGTWGALQWAPSWAIQMTATGPAHPFAKEYTQLAIAGGAVIGTVVAALAAGRFGRRITYAALCVASTAALAWLYQGHAVFDGRFLAAVALAGSVTAAFYGWFPLYLPELFATSIRATSQGFAYNFGRVLAAVGTLQTAQLMGLFGGSFPAAGTILSGIYLFGLIVIWFGPETSGLADDSPGHRPPRAAGRTALAAIALCGLATATGLAAEPAAQPSARSADDGWRTLAVPGVWSRATAEAVAAEGGVAWYRAWVKPDDSFFAAHDRNLFEESVGLVISDLAGGHAAWVNGVKIGGAAAGQAGADGDETMHRYKVPVGTLRKGEWNEIAIRVELPSEPLRSGALRGGFLDDAPFLMNYYKECVLEGAWQFQPGDALGGAAGRITAVAERPAVATFDAFRDSSQVLGRAEQVHGPSLPPAESAAKIHAAEPFAVDLLLHDPLIAQPFHFSFDERGRMWVTQSRQYPYPAGLKMLSRDKYYRSHYDRVPPAPPHHDRGADIVSIHESSRRDGVYDRHKVFLDGLNMADAALRGRGGVWVMHTPYLLFYPDADGDDVPDGPPEVRLAGFHFEDSHAIANGLVWGPDGWLYGAQGSTSSCTVRRPGLDADTDPGVSFTGCMVWRYHPESRAFEVFSEGGGNNFGLEFDAQGRLFTGHNGGSTRGFHFLQGGFYQKQGVDPGKYGPPRNPYAYGEFGPLFSTDTIVRFTHFGAFGNGTALPAGSAGRLFALDPLHNLVTNTQLVPRGPSFETRDGEPALRSDDVACRPVFITAAPDGSLCIADMYEYCIAHGQHYQNQIDPTTGRIYRLRGRDAKLETDTDLSGKTPAELVVLLSHPNVWHRRTAVRLLGERKDPGIGTQLRKLVGSDDAVAALHALWALHQSEGLDEATAVAALASPHPAVRSWTVRLLGDEWGIHRNLGVGRHAAAQGRSPVGLLPPRLSAALLDRAKTDDDIEVLCQIAASARRLDPPQAFPLVIALLERDRVAADEWVPQMCWWVFEANIPGADDAIIELFQRPESWRSTAVRGHILPRIVRRYAVEGKQQGLLLCAKLFRAAPSPDQTRPLMEGFEEAFRGRPMAGLPAELVAAIEAAGEPPLAFRLRRRDPQAVAEAIRIVGDPQADAAARLAMVRALGEIRQSEAVPTLMAIVSGTGGDAPPAAPELRAAALATLASSDDPAIGRTVAALLPGLGGQVRTAAYMLLAGRPRWSADLLDGVQSGGIAAADVPDDVAERLRTHKDATIRDRAATLLPKVAAAPGSARERVEEIRGILSRGQGNPYAGEGLFMAKCSQCHQLFHKGGNVGPNLTTYQRDDLGTMLLSIVDPSAEIREGYQYQIVETEDGRSLSGFFIDRDNQVTVLRSLDGETITLAAADIAEQQPLGRSLMPAGLLDGLDEQHLRDLFAYLRIKQPISR